MKYKGHKWVTCRALYEYLAECKGRDVALKLLDQFGARSVADIPDDLAIHFITRAWKILDA